MQKTKIEIDSKDVYTYKNADLAKKYIGEYGFFADTLYGLSTSVNFNTKYKLEDIRQEDKAKRFQYSISYYTKNSSLFLPEDKIKKD